MPGDVITAIGSYTLVGGADQFKPAVAARRPGDTMVITAWRSGAPVELAVEFPAPVTDEAETEGQQVQ